MSVAHNRKRRTSDICDGAPKGRGRCYHTSRSCFGLGIAAAAFLTSWALTSVCRQAVDLTTGISHERSAWRESVSAAKLFDPSDARLSI
jgi:hypothetical protein